MSRAMTCEAIQDQLYEATRLDALPAEMTAHIEGCPDCRACRDDVAVMLSSLRQDSELPTLPDGFELSLRRGLKQAASELSAERSADQALEQRSTGRRSTGRRGHVAVLVALAASLLLAFGVWTLIGSGADEPHSVTHHRLHLSVNARKPHAGARFEISLPAGVSVAPELAGALAAHNGKLVWRSDLQPGANEIDLPLVRRGDAPTTIRARLLVDGHSVGTQVELGPRPRAARRTTPRLTLALALHSNGSIEVAR